MTHGALVAETRSHIGDASAGQIRYASAASSKGVPDKGLSHGLEDWWTTCIGTAPINRYMIRT